MAILHRTFVGSFALGAALLLLDGCQSQANDATQPVPSIGSTASTSSAPTEQVTPSDTPSPSPTPAWQGDYSAQELAAYDEALHRFTTYERRSEPIWRRGKATPTARQLFQQYFYTWQSQFARLQTYEQVHVQIHGIPTVLASRATRVEVGGDGASATIRQCADYSSVTGYQDGKETEKVTTKPQVRVIVMTRGVDAQAAPWKITQLQRFEGDRPCKG
ncbi:hypothetical protein BH09ACT12_BH09ACT12_01780 [soil metagenome]